MAGAAHPGTIGGDGAKTARASEKTIYYQEGSVSS